MHSMNGEKSIMKDDHEFDSWRTSGPTHYQQSQLSQAMGASGQSVTNSDPYAGMSYYHTTQMFPYSTSDHMPSSQPWSNGAEPMTFLGGYTAEHNAGQHSGHSAGHYTMEAMFGSQSTYGFGSPFNAFFPSGSATDPFWGNNTKANRPNAGLGAPPGPTGYRMHDAGDTYGYHHDSYATAPGGMGDGPGGVSLKHVESGMAGLTLDHIKASEQFAGKPMSGPFSGSMSEPKKFDTIGSSSGAVGQVPKKMTWASIASQPAKPQPKSLKSKMSSSVLTGSTSKHLPPTSMEAIGTWESKNGTTVKTPPAVQTVAPPVVTQQRSASNSVPVQQQMGNQSSSWVPSSQRQITQAPSRTQTYSNSNSSTASVGSTPAIDSSPVPLPAHPVLDKLRVENNYNPKEFDLNPRNARFFIIKSYSEDDIHRSIKYSIWCSTEHGNKRLDNAFKQQEGKGPIYLLYSVNGSGHFCGMAQMMSYVDYNSSSNVWAQDKWKGQFKVKWIYVKDVPNAQLRHIRLENNENKPVTNSRDTQEVPYEKGKQVIKIMHHYRHTTSIFDDFLHYEKRQEEESQRRVDGSSTAANPPPPPPPNSSLSGSGHRNVADSKRQQQWKN